MKICLWVADGFSGVPCYRDQAEAEGRARAAAAACIADVGTATIELARLTTVSGDLQPGYESLGVCWKGRLRAGRVEWTRVALAAVA